MSRTMAARARSPSWASIAATAFLVNFRHVFYALSFPLHRIRSLPAKAYSTYALSDEAYALTVDPRARDWGRSRILLVQVFLQIFWVGSVTIGALVGTFIPDWVVGLNFAITALFLILAIEAFKTRRDVPGPVAAVLGVIIARLLVPGQMLLVSLLLFTAFLIIRDVLSRKRGGAPTDGPEVTHA